MHVYLRNEPSSRHHSGPFLGVSGWEVGGGERDSTATATKDSFSKSSVCYIQDIASTLLRGSDVTKYHGGSILLANVTKLSVRI